MNIILNTVVSLLLLIGCGFLSKKLKILKEGDEKVFVSYIYYFSLPSLFILTISEIKFTKQIIVFLIAGVVPILISLILYSLIYLVFHIKRDVFYLLSLSTIFGSLAFFGIPFVIFVLPETEKIATLMAAFVSAVAVFISIAMLEFYREKCVFSECLPKVFKKLSKNPLIISLFIGLFFSILDIPIPSIIKRVLDMFGKTTAVISMFMLGVFLQGKKYKNLKLALLLSMLRMFFLPFIALVISKLFYLSEVEIKVIVLMNAMPLAVSMIILSERYKFYEGVISSIILISSISSIIYLYFWLYIVGF